jgi:RNA polymerase sigma factor (sigma-70 family)
MIVKTIDAATLGDLPAPPDSIEELARTQVTALLRLASSILGDHAEAEDAVQDALLQAWKSWGQLRQPERRSAWLTQICVRRCLRIRVGLIRRRADGPDSDIATQAVATEQTWADWDASFRRLSRQQRAVVILHYQYQFTLDEAAAMMGCRPGSARRHLSRALVRLRKEIEK